MKIYFEDGRLQAFPNIPEEPDRVITVDANYGFRQNINTLKFFSQRDYVFYTNQITALSNEYAWNDELKAPEIYLRNSDGCWVRIDKLTNKELRKTHNLMKMYMAGAFNDGLELRKD